MDDHFTTEQGETFPAVVFEWSGSSSAVKPQALRYKTVMLVPKEREKSLLPLTRVQRESTGKTFVVKEVENTGIGLLEIRLEAIPDQDSEAISHGSF